MAFDHDAWMAEYRERRKERLLAQGLCTGCGKRPHIDGMMYCTECREKNRAKKRARFKNAVEHGLCIRCMAAKARDGRTMCLRCAVYEANRKSRYYWAKKEARAEGVLTYQ